MQLLQVTIGRAGGGTTGTVWPSARLDAASVRQNTKKRMKALRLVESNVKRKRVGAMLVRQF